MSARRSGRLRTRWEKGNGSRALLALLLVGTAGFFSSACVRVTAVTGPDGKSHLLIRCPGGQLQCLRTASERCPGHYRIVAHGTVVSGSSGNVSSNTEMLVRCLDSVDDDLPKHATGPIPEGALGYRFRINQAAAERRCEAQGFESRQQAGGIRCSGIAKGLPLSGFVDLRFCENDLCEIEAISTVAAEQVKANLTDVRQKLDQQYGRPTRSLRFDPPVCARERLLACVAEGRALFRDEWVWEDRHQIVLSVDERDQGLILKISYRMNATDEPAVKRAKSVEGL